MSELWRPRIEFRGRSTYSAPPVVSRAPSPPPAPKRPGAPLPKSMGVEMPKEGVGYGTTRREANLKAGKKRGKKTLRRRQKKTRRHRGRGGADEEPTSTPAETYPGEVAEVSENPTSPKGGRGKKKGSRRH